MKPTMMRDTPVGKLVFTLGRFDEYSEIRETYYTKVSDTLYEHHGCVQGDPNADEPPRYVNFDLKRGFPYPLVGALPVFPITQSAFLNGPSL